MLTFEQKLEVISSFPELERKNVSLGRINFHYEKSAHDKKIVVYHLHPNGNGFVYAGLLNHIDADDKGLVNIRELNAMELRKLITQSISSLAEAPQQFDTWAPRGGKKTPPPQEERWVGPDHAVLNLKLEDELWYIYSGVNLEAAFETYKEVEQYMREEQFHRE